MSVDVQKEQDLIPKSPRSPNPSTAALLSLAFPGAGQIYSKAYWHSPFFMAAEGYCIWRIVDSINRANDLWELRKNLTPGTLEYEDARSQFDYATTERNTYLWFLAGVKLLDIADAYVTAQFFSFDHLMNEQLTISITPEPSGGARLSLLIRF